VDKGIYKLSATMDDAVEKAAKFLPSSFMISIELEKGVYNVLLRTPNGSEIDVDGGDGMRSDIDQAIFIANGIE